MTPKEYTVGFSAALTLHAESYEDVYAKLQKIDILNHPELQANSVEVLTFSLDSVELSDGDDDDDEATQ